MAFLCIAFMGKKQKWRHVHSTSFQASLHIPFPPGKQWSEASPNFPHQNKGFINYVFCRNWDVRNPAGTGLDSSLVNKQVELNPPSQFIRQVPFVDISVYKCVHFVEHERSVVTQHYTCMGITITPGAPVPSARSGLWSMPTPSTRIQQGQEDNKVCYHSYVWEKMSFHHRYLKHDYILLDGYISGIVLANIPRLVF